MHDEELRPATDAEVEETLGFALRFDGRRPTRTADDMMARITAQRLVAQLHRSGYVLMKKPPIPNHSTPPSGCK